MKLPEKVDITDMIDSLTKELEKERKLKRIENREIRRKHHIKIINDDKLIREIIKVIIRSGKYIKLVKHWDLRSPYRFIAMKYNLEYKDELMSVDYNNQIKITLKFK